jgi:thioredoxin reductase (NADPH)
MMMNQRRTFDAITIGGGPAGLTAACYLGRFRRKNLVLDGGKGRARLIPTSHNCPGFPSGIGGPALLSKLRSQAEQYGVDTVFEEVVDVTQTGDTFEVSTAFETYRSDMVILATGVVDVTPNMPDLEEAINLGAIRLCPVCDGYEVIGKKLGVLGSGKSADNEARALKTYSDNVTVLTSAPYSSSLTDIPTAKVSGPITLRGNKIVVSLETGEEVFDAVYPALGCRVGSEFAVRLGAELDENRYIRVDEHLQTSVAGLFAIGDVASALNQIAVAFGHAAIASARIHKLLNERRAKHRSIAGRSRVPVPV